MEWYKEQLVKGMTIAVVWFIAAAIITASWPAALVVGAIVSMAVLATFMIATS